MLPVRCQVRALKQTKSDHWKCFFQWVIPLKSVTILQVCMPKSHPWLCSHLVSFLPDFVLHDPVGFRAVLAFSDAGTFSVLFFGQLQPDEHDADRLHVWQTVQDVLPLDDPQHLDDVTSGDVKYEAVLADAPACS